MPVHPLDIVILTIVGFTTFQGLRRGLIRSIFDIIAFFCAIALAMVWHGQIATFLTEMFHWSAPLPQAVSFLVVWIATYLVINLIGGGLHRLIRSSIFGPLNFLSGGLLGLLKGTLIIGLFLQFTLALPLPPQALQTIKDAQAVQWILPLAKATSPYLLKSQGALMPQGKTALPFSFPEPAPDPEKTILQ